MHKVAVVSFPGSNCDRDTARALDQLGYQVVWRHFRDRDLDGVGYVILPGGFSWGDYLRCGAIAAHTPIMDAICDGVERGVSVLGICNGFQILCERGLLPGVLRMNRDGNFRCTWETVRVVANPGGCRFSRGERFRLPIAHHEGAYTLEPGELERLAGSDQIFLQYCDADGFSTSLTNPNGSVANIAGVSNGTVVGLMPHPERAMLAYLGSTDGARFLRSWLEGEGNDS